MRDLPASQTPIGDIFDVLCPWHIVLDRRGVIQRTGGAVRKLTDAADLVGTPLFDFLELRRPKTLKDMGGLIGQSGRKLHFALRDDPHTELKGVIMPLPDGLLPGVAGGAILNLSFGISVIDAVRNYALTGADFAVTDLTVEMLYLVEAKSAVMEELRHLNERLQGARVEAEHQATTDTLTGLGNRRAMELAINRVMSRNVGFAMMHMDLDHFKAVNDTFGHAAGDAVLQSVAQRLREATRSGDTVVRHGGDEFILLLPGLVDVSLASNLAGRLVNEIEKPVSFSGEDLHVSASIGISVATDLSNADPERMMEEADTALYVVKEQGRHGFRVYTPDMGRMVQNDSEEGTAA